MLDLTSAQWKAKVKHWFFKNTVKEQRLALFKAFDLPEPGNHHEEMRLFRYIFRQWWEASEQEPPEGTNVEVAWREDGEWIHEIHTAPIRPEHKYWRFLARPE